MISIGVCFTFCYSTVIVCIVTDAKDSITFYRDEYSDVVCVCVCVQLGVQHMRNTTGAVQLMVMYFSLHGCNLV